METYNIICLKNTMKIISKFKDFIVGNHLKVLYSCIVCQKLTLLTDHSIINRSGMY